MNRCINEYRIQCKSCSAEISVSVLVPERYGPPRRQKAIERHSLNELLVDYGWLPTSKGYYCRRHAARARATFLTSAGSA